MYILLLERREFYLPTSTFAIEMAVPNDLFDEWLFVLSTLCDVFLFLLACKIVGSALFALSVEACKNDQKKQSGPTPQYVVKVKNNVTNLKTGERSALG